MRSYGAVKRSFRGESWHIHLKDTSKNSMKLHNPTSQASGDVVAK
jgi:hypothetical protein